MKHRSPVTNYSNNLFLNHFYKCHCKHQLVMYGCDNPLCDNHYIKNLLIDATKKQKELEV